MCTSPIFIKNPYFHCGGKGLNHLHDTRSAYVRVPCGQCKQCLSMRQGYINQRVQMESLRSELFFFTLTYANRGLCKTDIGEYKVPYPNYKDIQNLFKRLRKILPHSIRYYVVSEYGKKEKRPHFHGIIAVSKDDIKTYYRGSHLYCEKQLFRLVLSNWKRNISNSHKFPVYIDLCDFVYKRGRCTYDLHWIEPIRNHDNDVSFYVTKYILKYDKRTQKLLNKIKLDVSLDDTQTKVLTSLIKPRSIMSKDFGSYKLSTTKDYINKCLSRNSELPQFFDLNTGSSMLLSPYYRNHLLSLDYANKRYYDYLQKLKVNRIDFPYHSYNLDLFDDSSIHDFNCKSMSAIKQDKQLNRQKNCISKRY